MLQVSVRLVIYNRGAVYLNHQSTGEGSWSPLPLMVINHTTHATFWGCLKLTNYSFEGCAVFCFKENSVTTLKYTSFLLMLHERENNTRNAHCCTTLINQFTQSMKSQWITRTILRKYSRFLLLGSTRRLPRSDFNLLLISLVRDRVSRFICYRACNTF